MEDNIEKKPLVEIITELSKLEQKIDLYTLKYELLRQELIRRYPIFENEEEFKKKVFKK